MSEAHPMNCLGEAPAAPNSSSTNDGRTAEDILQFAEEEMIRALVAFSGAAARQMLDIVGLPFLTALSVEAYGVGTTRPLVSPRLIPTGGALLQPQPPATADTLESNLADRAPKVPYSRQGGSVRVQTPRLTLEEEHRLRSDVSAAADAARAQVRRVGTVANVAADRAATAAVISESERDDVKDEIGELMKLYDCLMTKAINELLGQETPPGAPNECADDGEG